MPGDPSLIENVNDTARRLAESEQVNLAYHGAPEQTTEGGPGATKGSVVLTTPHGVRVRLERDS